MTQQEFIDLLSETLDTEKILTIDTALEQVEEYDSIGILSLMSMYDDLGIKVSPNYFEQINTIADLVKLAKL